MSFSFNFPNPDGNGETNTESQTSSHKMAENEDGEKVEPFRESFPSGVALSPDLTSQAYQLSSGVCLQCIDSQAVERKLCDSQGSSCSIVRAAEQHSDLIPNVYEGGLKVWECAIDLIEFLHTSGTQFIKKTVLELGCGAGLPGILAMLNGASVVHFQDYNHEVVENYTIPNVTLNTTDQYTCTCRYFSGDWSKFKDHMAPQNIKYDIILTAETIYKPENYRKLTDIFEAFLSDSGEVYVAAKSNYFGVGGGTHDFENFVHKHGRFNINSCHLVESGVPREILKLTWMT